MGLFESFGKNELQGDTINQKPVVGEKEKRETIVEQFTENSEETDEIRKSDFEAFKKNIDEWYNNYNKIFDISKEEEVLHSEISKGQDNSDRLSKDKSKYGKNFSLNGFAVDENLLSTLAADFNNGYMTESQKIYLSSQVDEICKEANIFSVDRLQKILNVFFHSDVVNTICDNSILLELINKKQNKLKIKVAAIAFVMVFLLFMVSGGSRTLFAMGVALIGMFAVMGLAGFGGFYLAREKFVWNLLISILVAVPAGIAGGLIFAFLMSFVI